MGRLTIKPLEMLQIRSYKRLADTRISDKVVVRVVLNPKKHQRFSWRSIFALTCSITFISLFAAPATAGFLFDFAPQSAFTLTNTNADGSVNVSAGSVILTGGNNLSLEPGTTDYVATATSSGLVNFDWSYSSLDSPGFDFAGYLLAGNFVSLADTDGENGTGTFSVVTGESFGFRVGTADNSGEPGVLTVNAVTSSVPEPGTGSLLFVVFVIGITIAGARSAHSRRAAKTIRRGLKLAVGLLAGSSLFAQSLNTLYTGTNITGSLVLTGQTVNLLSLSQQGALPQSLGVTLPEAKPKAPPIFLPPPAHLHSLAALVPPAMNNLPVAQASTFGFNGLTHLDQRNANNGNQYSVEPPNPSVATGNGYILVGVNNAVQVYSTTGTPLLPVVLATNQVFGIPAAINRATNIAGVFPTDMRVFYDQGLNRWFILQRAQCCDSAGNNINHSQIYIAVSQSGDPTGNYSNYFIDTTDSQETGCPMGCVSDYPQIGVDQYGFYISSDQYPITATGDPSTTPIGADILAISKTALAAGASTPTTYEFVVPTNTGFEFAISPAVTPPGGSYSVGLGGVEFFVSSIATGASSLAVWAMVNTMSLNTASPSLTLFRTIVATQPYSTPPNANQKPGPLPYGSTQIPGFEAPVDTLDCRMLSLVAAAGRLYVTFAALVQDQSTQYLAGVAYFVLSPTFRGTLAATVLAQGNLVTNNNHLVKPSFGVNAQGQGALAFTLVGPGYYPSAAFVPVNAFSPPNTSFSLGSAIQLAAPGAAPEDGFTGYQDGVARWGDYSTSVTGSDGSIWMIAEYIPNLPRTTFANWGTFLMHYVP